MHTGNGFELTIVLLDDLSDTNLNPGLKTNLATSVSPANFSNISEYHSLTNIVNSFPRHPIDTQHDILRGNNDRFTIRRKQNVIGRHHQRSRFKLRLECQRHMYRHLIAVKVSVVGSTDQGMQLNCLTFNQNGLKCLDSQSMQCRCTI